MHFWKQRSLRDLPELPYSRWSRTLLLFVGGAVLASATVLVLRRYSAIEKQKGSSSYQSSVPSNIPTVTLCELLANPQSYDVKVIRVEAILVANHGDRSLYDPSCITREPMVGGATGSLASI